MNGNHELQPPTDGQGFEILGRHDRVEFRMLTDEQKCTPDVERQLIGELQDWRRDHPAAKDPGKPYPLNKLSDQIGVSPSVLTEWINGKYKGDSDAVARKVDQFLADERQRAGRFDFRQHAKIALTHKIFGAIKAGIINNTMPVIIGPPGCGKTAHARAFQSERGGVLYVRIEEERCTDRGITALLCDTIQELRPMKARQHRQRLDSIKTWLRKRRNTVLLVDECQKLDASGLEMLRTLHDITDPDGAHCMPIVFFGDEHFYKLLVRAKAGDRSPIAPQMIRRMVPVFDVAKDGGVEPDGGGDLYTVQDIVAIVRNDRVKLLDRKALRWLTDLANVAGFGQLGFAIKVLQIACDLMEKRGEKQVDVEHLQMALGMTAGRSVAVEIDQAAGGELLAKIA